MSIISTKYKADGISFDFFLSNGEIGGTGPDNAGYESIVKRAQGDGHWPPSAYDPYEGRDLATAKAEKIQAIKLGARRQFREYTDWYVIRKTENGTTIPVAVTSYRNQMRTAVADAENVINSLTTKQAVADYSMIWPSKPGGI